LSSEAGRLNHDDDTRAVLTAIVLEDDGPLARKMRGVKVELLTEGDHDEIYLDEGARPFCSGEMVVNLRR
jgi:hypothetical protein